MSMFKHNTRIGCPACGVTHAEYSCEERAAPAVDALTTGAVAEVESWTNGSYHRNYKLRWLRDVEKGTKLYTHPASEPKAVTLTDEQREAIKHLIARGSTFPAHNGRNGSSTPVDYVHLQTAAKVLSALLADRGS
jgi:hypothetical protein